ncbi:MAG: trypsin-like peptidase domain-containing protein [Clostridiales bacterium]|mgnify:CR=1 FL=1|nr:trypsin-like peptidase domain-containing protein [Clostridiales bacterium]
MEQQNAPKRHNKIWMQVCIAVLCLAVGISIGILAFSGRSGQISQIEPTASPSATATPNNGQSTTPNTGSSNLADVIDSVMPSVVSITTTQYAQRAGTEVASGYGSGFVYSADGLIATNNHVVEGAGRIYVTLNGDEQQYEAEVVATDSYSDLAILKIDKTGLTPVKFGSSSSLRLGDTVFVIGSPYNGLFANSVSSGIVSGLNREMVLNSATQTFIQTDAAVNPGNSGGPMFNANGELVGIITRKSMLSTVTGETTSIEGIGFAIPSDVASPVLEQLAQGQQVPRSGIGIMGSSLTEQGKQAYNVENGIYVASVSKGGPAEKAGLEVGDIITKLDGQAIGSMDEMIQLMESKNIGDTITLTYVRDGQENTATVTIGDKTQMSFE